MCQDFILSQREKINGVPGMNRKRVQEGIGRPIGEKREEKCGKERKLMVRPSNLLKILVTLYCCLIFYCHLFCGNFITSIPSSFSAGDKHAVNVNDVDSNPGINTRFMEFDKRNLEIKNWSGVAYPSSSIKLYIIQTAFADVYLNLSSSLNVRQLLCMHI